MGAAIKMGRLSEAPVSEKKLYRVTPQNFYMELDSSSSGSRGNWLKAKGDQPFNTQSELIIDGEVQKEGQTGFPGLLHTNFQMWRHTVVPSAFLYVQMLLLKFKHTYCWHTPNKPSPHVHPTEYEGSKSSFPSPL